MKASTLVLAIAGLACLAACADRPEDPAPAATAPDVASASAPAPAYRVRAGREAPLNADTGWSAGLSESATVRADAPFRLRFEVAPPDGLDAECVRLEYRRNGGPWTAVEAHDFPYPLRELELESVPAAGSPLPPGWRAASPEMPLLFLYAAPWDLEGVFDFGAEYRLDPAGPGHTSLVFGYADPDNHWRLTLDAETGRVRVLRIEGGTAELVAEQPAAVRAGEWQQAEVQLEDGLLGISFNDDAVEFSLPAPPGLPAGEFGFLLPAPGAAELRSFVIEGEPSSPRVSIVATGAYEDGTATTDLLAGIAAAHAGGSGVSLAACAPLSLAAGQHAELEWPLVIRRFADGAVTNEPGDVFEFRLVDGAGQALPGAPVPVVTLDVPAGHLGGTFVETPGRVGPWRTANGDLYFIMEPAESDNLFMVVKSTDGGRSWREVDGANRPATGDLEAVDARLVGDTIHILHQVTEATLYHAFRTSAHPEAPDTWAVTDETATAVTASNQMATLVVRPDGTMVAFHLGDTIGYSIRSTAGEWSPEVVLDQGGLETAGPQAVLGSGGVVHLAYYGLDGTIWHRRLLPGDTLTEAQLLDDGAAVGDDHLGPVLPLVYLPEIDTVVVVYRRADGRLYERRIAGATPASPAVMISDLPVVQHAVDSQQAGADAAGWDGGVVVAFIDQADRSIYTTVNRGDGWEAPARQVEGIRGAWVRGNVYRRDDGALVYGYVYDAGSEGGAGMNRYAELVLEPAGEPVVLRFAVLGDAEPKPEPEFPNLAAAVRDVNALAADGRLDFVVGVGDIAHKGTLVQYENAAAVLEQLELPFYPIMGNEEHDSTTERFLEFANRWNDGQAEIPGPRYTRDLEHLVMVHASPDYGRDFNDEGVAWILAQVRAAYPRPVFLVVHGAQAGVYPENPDKGISNPAFAEVVAQPNLAAVISGDLHMDMDRVGHSRQLGRVHYLHIPALERTKIPDATQHTPMFRVFTVTASGEVLVDTYQVGQPRPLERHAYRFSLSP